jgi:hypothetical protein
LDQNVRGTSLEIPAGTITSGPYYWTIQAFADEQAASSRLRGLVGESQFSIRKLQPVNLDSPEVNAEITGALVLRWSTPETLGRSRLVISQNPNPLSGRPVQEFTNPDRAITLNLFTAGIYYWTVIAETTDGLDISAAAPRRFRILPQLFPEPIVQFPADGLVVGPEQLKENRNIIFSWDPIEGADAYIFALFREDGTRRQQIVRTRPQQQSSWTLDDLRLLGEGNFVWQVEAVKQGPRGNIEQQGQIGENRFSLHIPMPNQVETIETGILYGN